MQYKIHNVFFMTNVFVSQAYLILIPIISLEIFKDKNYVATIGILETMGGLLFGLLSILIIENIKNKKALILCSLILFLIFLGQYMDVYNNKLIFASSLILFIVTSRIIENVQNALMFSEYQSKGNDELEKFNSFTSTTYIIVGIVIAPLSVLIYKNVGISYLLILSLPILLLSFFINSAYENKKNLISKKDNSFKERFNIFIENKKISRPIFLINLIMFSALMVSTIFFLYITQDLKYSVYQYTFLLTVQSIGSIVVSMFIYKKYLKKNPKLISYFIILFGLVYLLFGFLSKNFLLLNIYAFLLGVCFTTLLMMLNEIYQKNCPSEVYGTVNSIRITLNNVAGLAGAGLGSALYINYGSTVVMVTSALLLFSISLIFKKVKGELTNDNVQTANLKKISGND